IDAAPAPGLHDLVAVARLGGNLLQEDAVVEPAAADFAQAKPPFDLAAVALDRLFRREVQELGEANDLLGTDPHIARPARRADATLGAGEPQPLGIPGLRRRGRQNL